uniref:Integrase, catalytic region, zinc finger, CCHC-type, peptidase aspartic, catalytic n=1 Tax=Tanacetum cinerariifolium TaxID=118510 RepID=A0A699HP77_TANCI|nr:integrase, catalytic region, zinc finger, CCHC-type, peptidase aspartic, catalytic [Tanacetum cinerariifolium]
MDINIDALYNIIKQNQGDVNDAMGSKKKTVVVTSDPLALIAEKINVTRSKEKVVVSSDSEGSEANDFSELKRITALLAKAFNRRKFYSKPTNNNLRTSSSSQSANKKQEFVKTDNKRVEKKDDEKKRDMSRVKCYNCKKEWHFAKDCKKVKEINENMVFMAQIEKVLSDSEASSSSADEKISEEKYAKLEAERHEYMIRYSAYFDNDKQHRKQIANQQVLYDKMSVQLVELDKHVRDLKNTVLEKDFKIYELEECVRHKDLEIEKCLERLNICENKLHKLGQTNQTVHMIMPSKDNLYNGRKGIGFENLKYFEKAKDLRPTLYDEKVIGLGYTLMFLTHSDEALEIEKFKRSRENKIEFAYDYGNLNASYQTSSLKPYVPNVILEKIIINLEDEVVNLFKTEKANLEIIESLKSKGFESSESAVSKSENQNENDCHEIEKVCDKEENPKVISPGMFKLNVSQCVSQISMSKSSRDSKNVEIKLKRKRCKRKSSKQNDKHVNNNVLHANKDFVHFLDLDTFSSVRRPKNSGVVWKKKWSSNTSNVGLYAVSVSNLKKNVKRYSRKDLLACNNYHLGKISSASVCNDVMNVSCDSRMNDLLDDNNFFIFNDVNVRISPVSKMHVRKKPRDSMNVSSKSNLNTSLPRIVHKWLPKMKPLAEPVAKWIPRIVQICLWIIDSGCSKHMMCNRALLMNFVEKFLGTSRFGNNDFAVIAGYRDVVIGSMMIKKVYYVEGLGHNLFSVGQFCDKGLEVAFRMSTCFVRNEDGVDFLTGDRSSNLYTIALNEVASNFSTCLLAKASSSKSWLWHQRLSYLSFTTINNLVKNNLVQGLPKMKFEKIICVPLVNKGRFIENITTRTPQQNSVVKRRNRTLVKAARTMLTFANLPSFLWAEAIIIACFTQNRLIIHKRFDKTPYELINKRKPNIKFFRVFGCRCYLLNDYEDVGKLKAKGDIGVFVGYSKEFAAFRIYNKRTRKIHESVNVNFDEISEMASKQFSLEPGLSNLNETGKSSNLSVSQVDEASKKDLEDLLQDFYDEYFDSSKIMKSSTTNVETFNVEIPSNEEEVFHKVSESFQGESSSSSLNDDV